jgi:hypothetical protein
MLRYMSRKHDPSIPHQEHFGKKFYKDLQNGYWISTDCPKIRAHRWVWIKTHGVIPKGYHIHHINEDRSDNRIENLELIEKSRHIKHHWDKHPEWRKKAQLHAEKIRPLTKEWHKSAEGRSWHKANGILAWIKKKERKGMCKICGTKFSTKTYHQEFCSNKCKSAWRRKSGIDDIEKECVKCSSKFKVNKYSKQIYCSRICGSGRKKGEGIGALTKANFIGKIGAEATETESFPSIEREGVKVSKE